MTVATREEGLSEFHERLSEHIQYLRDSGIFSKRREERLRRRVQKMVEDRVVRNFWTAERVARMEKAIHLRRSPYEIALDLITDGN